MLFFLEPASRRLLVSTSSCDRPIGLIPQEHILALLKGLVGQVAKHLFIGQQHAILKHNGKGAFSCLFNVPVPNKARKCWTWRNLTLLNHAFACTGSHHLEKFLEAVNCCVTL